MSELKPEDFGIERVISYTTRPPRAGERDGVDYHFVDQATMVKMQAQGELLECTEFTPGAFYGTPRRPVQAALAAGRDVLIKPEVRGAAKIKADFPDAVMIFWALPSVDEAVRRLRARQSESAEQIKVRIALMRDEMAAAHDYDYVVVNETGKLQEAVARVRAIVERERRKRGLSR